LTKVPVINNFRIAIFFALLMLACGCREDVVLNSRISPASDSIGVYQQNLKVITHTYFDDSVETSLAFPGVPVYEGVGVFNDPFFGSMNCATYFQLLPSESGFSFPAGGGTIDSAKLILPYSGFTWGDSANASLTQTFQVFYLLDSLQGIATAIYYPNYQPAIDVQNPLSAPYTFNIYHLIDSFYVTGIDHAGLRIPLNLNYLRKLLVAACSKTNNTANFTQLTFLSYFNGLCVKASNSLATSTSLPYFRLDGTDPYSQAGIMVYFRDTITNSRDSQNFYFDNSYCTHYNSILNSYGHNPVNNLYHSAQKNDSIVALQNQPGASIDLKIVGIRSLPKLTKGIINKAEIQLTMLSSYFNGGIYFAPERIYATGVATATYPGNGITLGEKYTLADRYPLSSLTPLNVMDGFGHTGIAPNGATTYTIDIPRELMQAMADSSDTIHVEITGTQDFFGAFHMVAAGGSYSDSNYRAKFKVVYSQIKK